MRSGLAWAALVAVGWCGGAGAQVIYPLDRAEILAGSRFDMKVEFPGVTDPARVRVQVNGQDAAALLGKAAEFTEREDGQAQSSVTLRDVSITAPGRYTATATDGDRTASVSWEVYAAPAPRRARNVILFIGDGMTVANVTAARIMSAGMKEGRYNSHLTIDSMPYTALVGTSGTDSVVTDSANSASAYNTGHKSGVNALGVYASRARDTLAHPKVETLASVVRRQLGMSVGIVTNTEIQDATPAAVFSHTRRRSDYVPITDQMLESGAEVIMGGGSASFLPRSVPGSRRADERNMVDAFKQQGYVFADTSDAMLAAAADPATRKLLGLYNLGNMDGALDRFYLKRGTVPRFPNQPDLTDQVGSALKVLERNPNGFFLMVESGLIDKYSHRLDWERSVFDTILLDRSVKVATEWAAGRDDTLIIVVPDHTHGMGIVGTVNDQNPATEMRDRVDIYADAKFPNYPPADARGYPPSVDVSRRLAIFYSSFPDYYESYRPHLNGINTPSVGAGPTGPYVANEKEKDPLSQLRIGNLPRVAEQGVHTADDAVLRAMGPGSDRFHGFIDNTEVFRGMAEALGLGR